MSIFSSIKETLTSITRTRLNEVEAKGVTVVKDTSFTSSLSSPMTSWIVTPDGKMVDFEASVKNPQKNSAVASALNWVGRVYPEAEPMVERLETDGTRTRLVNHAMVQLLHNPNPYYSGVTLARAAAVSYVASGDAYILKIRNNLDKVIQLWWLDPCAVTPKGDGTTEGFITYYLYQPDKNKDPQKFERRDIIHIRNGIDPENTLKGRSEFYSVLREIATDDEATMFAAALLRNSGVPGVVISPRNQGDELDTDVAAAVKQQYLDTVGGINRGKPMVLSAGILVEKLSFNPQEMDLTQLHRLSEERIAAVLGIPAIVLGLGAGLEASTYSNVEGARQMAYENYIIPMQAVFAVELHNQLLPDFEADTSTLRVSYDISKIRVLQPDLDALAKRMDIGVRGGWIKRSEARKALGLPVGPEDDVYLQPTSIIPVLGIDKGITPDA